MPSSSVDYNREMSPVMQRFLLGTMVLAGIGSAIIFIIAGLVYFGVIPASTVNSMFDSALSKLF